MPNKLNMANKVMTTVVLVLVTISAVLFSTFYIADATSSHNFVANQLLSAAPLHNLGLPYKDYWDLYSPGIYILLTPVEFFFGGSTIVIKLLHLSLVILIGFVFYRIVSKFVGSRHLRLTIISIVMLVYLIISSVYSVILLHNTLIGLAFSILGLYALTHNQKEWSRYLVSTLLFAASTSIKEVYLFTLLLPALIITSRYLFSNDRSLKKFFVYSGFAAIGAFSIIVVNLIYLVSLDIVKNYLEVTDFKSTRYSGSLITTIKKLAPLYIPGFIDSFSKTWQSIFVLPIGGLYYLILGGAGWYFLKPQYHAKQRKLEWSDWTPDRSMKLTFLSYLLLQFEGFKIIDDYHANYVLQLIPAIGLCSVTLILIGVDSIVKYRPSIKSGTRTIRLVFGGLIIALVTVAFIPNNQFLTYLKPTTISQYLKGLQEPKPLIDIPTAITSRKDWDNRVFCAYGWGTPVYYYLSHTKPYSRFILIHPNVIGPAQIKELITQFKQGLPKIVVYSAAAPDIDVVKFESETIHLKSLLTTCYDFLPWSVAGDGYWVLKDELRFKNHLGDFVAQAYL